MTQNYLSHLALKVYELKICVKWPPDIFQNIKIVQIPNLNNFIRVIKNSSFNLIFAYLV